MSTSGAPPPDEDRTRLEFQPDLYHGIPAGYYDAVYARERGIQWFWHHRRFTAVAKCLPPSGGSILDLGCGPGTFLGHFAAGYQHALGIDLAEAQIEYARRRYGNDRVRFEAEDVAAFRRSGEFDAIVSIEVIEHLPPGQMQPFLRSIVRLLKPGGTLVITTPNYRSLWPVIESLVSRVGPLDYRAQHINRLNRKRLVEELERAGFLIRFQGTFFVFAPFLAALSVRLAELVYKWEGRFLPKFGSEIIVRAEKPDSDSP